MTKSYIGINSAAEKGYAVGIYDSETHSALFENSGFQPNFARAIKRVIELAILYPESYKGGIHANFSPLGRKEDISSWERDDVINGIEKLINHFAQSSPKCITSNSNMEIEERIQSGELGVAMDGSTYETFAKDKSSHPWKKY